MKFDPNAKFGFEVKFENELPNYVTVDELLEIVQQKEYQKKVDDRLINLKKDKQTGLLYTSYRGRLFPGWVSAHIFVTRCMQNPDLYDWARITDMYNLTYIADLVYIWMNPYLWIPRDDAHFYGCLVLGKVATQKYDESRNEHFIYEWLTRMYQERALFFADYRPCSKMDQQSGEGLRILKGMVTWDLLTSDARKCIGEILDGAPGPCVNIEYFNEEIFRDNLQYIAEERGGRKAIELVQQFRKDWPSIVAWKCFGIDKITPEQVEKFRACLFEGMDYYLEQWESESPEPTPNQKPASFPLLSDQCHKENKVEGVEAELRAACRGTAVALWKTIRTNEALGYLLTKNMSASKIYHDFADYFGELPYNERNFRDARNK